MRLDFISRVQMTPPASDHFNGKTFFQAHHGHAARRLDLLKWRLSGGMARWPQRVDIAAQPPPPQPRGHEIVATWIGHATFLLQTAQGNFLTDPVFSERASPVSWAGPRRVHPPGVALDALPRIDAVLLSHDHYDHCDLRSLRALAARHEAAVFIAPLRHRDLLDAARARHIVELDWWQSHGIAGTTVTLTPTQHWSNRFGTPRNHRLWGGFMLTFSIFDGGHLASRGTGFSISEGRPVMPGGSIENRNSKVENARGAERRVWFVGDTGYEAAIFRAVRERCGAPDLALVPIGAYEPRWFMAPMHMNPAEAVQAHRDAGAQRSIGMHWGTFQLTDEAREAPLEALAVARAAAGVSPDEFEVVVPGGSRVV
jgi:L-ascorbate metabolism protein UlaG (beta-lactamase superfamily)